MNLVGLKTGASFVFRWSVAVHGTCRLVLKHMAWKYIIYLVNLTQVGPLFLYIYIEVVQSGENHGVWNSLYIYNRKYENCM